MTPIQLPDSIDLECLTAQLLELREEGCLSLQDARRYLARNEPVPCQTCRRRRECRALVEG